MKMTQKIFYGKVTRILNCGAGIRGNTWYGKKLPNEKQVWVIVREGKIRDCGFNDIPRVYNNKTGLSRLMEKL